MQAPDIAAGCKDIAAQLVAWPRGDGLEVAPGGGRDRFLPTTMADPEDAGRTGSRKDGLAKADLEETLVIVTADHSRVFTIGGYPERNNPIFGTVQIGGRPTKGSDGKGYTTLGYANGPGAVKMNAERPKPLTEDTKALGYKQQALVPMESGTHAGEDVGIFAVGPWAHLFQGVVEAIWAIVALRRWWMKRASPARRPTIPA